MSPASHVEDTGARRPGLPAGTWPAPVLVAAARRRPLLSSGMSPACPRCPDAPVTRVCRGKRLLPLADGGQH